MTERGEASRIGAKLHKNSGRGKVKADATWGPFIVDFKEVGKTFTLSADVWAKICTDAVSVDRSKSPLLIITIAGKTRLAVLELAELESIYDRLTNNT